jgi:hypothetical protein
VRINSKIEREKSLQAKDMILGIKVLRQDYLIEAVSVPLAEVQVEEGRNADNSALGQCEEHGSSQLGGRDEFTI